MHRGHGFLSACWAACALLLAACHPYDASLLREPNPAGLDAGPDAAMDARVVDGSMRDGGSDAAKDTGVAPCVPQREICDGTDNDCDGIIDEDTVAYCESVIVHAKTACVAV